MDKELSLSAFSNDVSERIQEVTPGRFPLDSFPKSLAKIVSEYNRTLNYPIDYMGTSILFAASMGIGNTYLCEVRGGFQVNAVLYCALVGKPGTMKTHPLNFAVRPILDRDEISIFHYKDELRQYEEYQAMSKKDRDKSGLNKKGRPPYLKYICSDYTPEVLGEIHDFNRRGIGIYNDELAGWIKNFGRYSKGSEMEFWLSNWSRQPIVVDRKGGDKIFIKNPFISVIGGIQNGILDILSKEGRDQNGFLDRILFAYPDDMDKAPWNENELDEIFSQRYHRIINKLLDIPADTNEVLKFDPSAKKKLFEWNKEITNQINEAPDSLRGPLTKLEGYAPRLCLIIQLLRWACDEAEKDRIDLVSVDAALKLVEYFRHNAVKVNQHFHTTPVERLPENIRTWYEALPSKEFKTSEAVEIGIRGGMSERNIKYYLSQLALFRRFALGRYLKVYA